MKRKFVSIIWRDIHTITDEKNMWQDKEEAIENSLKFYNTELITCGEIIESNSKFVVVAGTSCPTKDGFIYSDISMIPKSVIIKIKIIN